MEYRDEKRCNPHKLPVSVRADHLHDGRTLPRMFRTEDSVQAVVIDRVLDVCETFAEGCVRRADDRHGRRQAACADYSVFHRGTP